MRRYTFPGPDQIIAIRYNYNCTLYGHCVCLKYCFYACQGTPQKPFGAETGKTATIVLRGYVLNTEDDVEGIWVRLVFWAHVSAGVFVGAYVGCLFGAGEELKTQHYIAVKV